jgi:hypothetical protein
MATATVSFAISTAMAGEGTVDQRTVTYFGAMTFSAAADTYLTGGLLAKSGAAFKNLGPYGDRTPLQVVVFSTNGSGWNYQWNITTSKLQIFSGTSGGATSASTELTNSTALSGGTPEIFTDTISFKATFPRV